APRSALSKPNWVAGDRQLWFRGQMLREYPREAPNQLLLLASFQKKRWARRIENPLPGDVDYPKADQLVQTVKNLNRSLQPPLLGFKVERNREGVRWYEVTEQR